MKILKTLLVTTLFMLSLITMSNASTGLKIPKCMPASVVNAVRTIEKRFGSVEVVSAYSKRKIAGTRTWSKHASCKAIDIHIKRNKAAAIRWLHSKPLEIITYGCGMHHVHIATGSYKGHHCVNSYGLRLSKFHKAKKHKKHITTKRHKGRKRK